MTLISSALVPRSGTRSWSVRNLGCIGKYAQTLRESGEKTRTSSLGSRLRVRSVDGHNSRSTRCKQLWSRRDRSHKCHATLRKGRVSVTRNSAHALSHLVHIDLDHNEKMPMTEMNFGDQTVRHDREATAAIYASLNGGWAEDRLCVGCRNLMVQRDKVYPSAFRELLGRLGIDPNKEGEAVADGPLKNGLHHYGGWFFFVGEMVTVRDQISVSDSP
jgi:hypothetical protein